jgi:hypothetical protein
MNLNNKEINSKLIIPIIIIILFFRMPANSNYLNLVFFRDIAKNVRETKRYPSLQYEKHLQSTMLVEITGAVAQKRKGA